ncbi:T9SS type A sorting domain-containing protein [Chryseolinea sp. T2]|uniref:Ig-like domain-containing protein n=1 Tax=Chryseolinea sp. T2 TaxID=3129255 RepID=UPI003076C543
MMRGIFTLVFCLGVSYVFGQLPTVPGTVDGQYQSYQGGAWTSTATWARWNNTTKQWVTPATAPTNVNADVITIVHNVQVTTGNRNVDQVVVAAGATLTISGGTLSIMAGAGDDMTINGTVLVSGTGLLRVNATGAIIVVNGTLNNGSEIQSDNVAKMRFDAGSVYIHNTEREEIPLATWQPNSLCRIIANVSPVPGNLNQAFYDVEWNTPILDTYLDLEGTLVNVAHNLTFVNTGGSRVHLSQYEDFTLNVGNDFIIQPSALVVVTSNGLATVNVGRYLISQSPEFGGSYGSGAANISVTDSVKLTNGTFYPSGENIDEGFPLGTGITTLSMAGSYKNTSNPIASTGAAPRMNMNFTGAGTHGFVSTIGQTFPINFAVQSTGNLDIAAASFLAGPGTLDVASGARVTVRSVDTQGAYRTSVARGNVRVTGARTITGALVYGGTALQRISPETPTNITTIINNAAHVRMLSNLDFSAGTVDFNVGNLQVRTFTLTLVNVAQHSGRIQVQNTSNLIINGSGVYGNAAGNNTTGQLYLSGTQIGSLTINRSGGLVTRNANLTIVSLLDLKSGTLALANTTTNVNGNFAVTTGNLTAAGGTLTIQNAGTMPTGVSLTGTLATLTMNRTGTLNLTNASPNIDVTRLNVYNGSISNAGGLRMANGGTIYRTNGQLTAAIGAAGRFNVQYLNFTAPSIIAGFEIPASNVLTNVTINNTANSAGIVALPLNSTLTASGQIRVQSGRLHANNSNINVGGNFRIDAAGGLVPGHGTYTFNGAANQTFTSTPAAYSFVKIVVNKTGGSLTLASPLAIRNSFEVNSITTVTAGTDRLTLRSTADSTAYIPAMPGTAANNRGRINGSVIVQRYLPNGNSSRQYRYLSAPTTTTVVSDWKNEIPISGTFSDPSTGTFDGVKINATNPSMFYFNEPTNAYVPYPASGLSSAATIVSGRGYSVFGRTHSVTPLTLDSHGTLGQFSVNVGVTKTGSNPGFNLVGNPFPAPILWDAVLRTGATISSNVDGTISFIDNNQNVGTIGYVTYNGNTGVSVPDGAFNGVISMGQGFWVTATNATGTVRFREEDKIAGQSKFIREGAPDNLLRLAMTQGSVTDHLAVMLMDSATDAYDSKYDGYKFKSSGLRVSTLSSKNDRLVINAIAKGGCEKVVPIEIAEGVKGNYTFTFTGLESFDSDIHPVLFDKSENKSIELSSNPVYTFSVSDVATVKGRFEIRFNGTALDTQLTVKGETICVGNSSAVITLPTSQAGVQYTAMLNEAVVSSAVTGNGGQIQIPVSVDALPQGASVITISAQRASCTSQVLTEKATINVLRKPVIGSVTPAQVCGTGTASLTASAVEGSLFNWYDGIDDETPIEGQHGANFTTVSLSKSKTYYVAAVNAAGCEGERVEVKATVLDLTPAAISVDGNTLTSNYESGNQWYLDGEVIDGANGKSIEATSSGVYTVVVNTGTCSTTSEGREMLILGTESADGFIRIYPNPAPDKVYVEVRSKSDAAVELISTTGVQLRSAQLSGNDDLKTATFDITSLPDGMYLVRVNAGTKTFTKKILKAK